MQPAKTGERPISFSGRWIVVDMFLFATVAIGLLWSYSVKHAEPFLPLQRALAAEFQYSQPRVDGGQRKMHKQTPRILRIVMKVDFDPSANDERTESHASRITSFANRHHDLSAYDLLEIHLFWLEPEGQIKQVTIKKQVAALLGS